MFKIGDKVRLIHHGQYPALVGLKGEIIHVGVESSLDGDQALPDTAPSQSTAEPVYRVHAAARTLYDVPESWLTRG